MYMIESILVVGMEMYMIESILVVERGMGETLGVTDIFIIFIVMIASCVYTYAKIISTYTL